MYEALHKHARQNQLKIYAIRLIKSIDKNKFDDMLLKEPTVSVRVNDTIKEANKVAEFKDLRIEDVKDLVIILTEFFSKKIAKLQELSLHNYIEPHADKRNNTDQ